MSVSYHIHRARPFLFSMDAETAHEHTLSMLAKTQNTPLQCLYAQKRVDDSISLAGLPPAQPCWV
jgi:dihydroorotate dehydrogenase